MFQGFWRSWSGQRKVRQLRDEWLHGAAAIWSHRGLGKAQCSQQETDRDRGRNLSGDRHASRFLPSSRLPAWCQDLPLHNTAKSPVSRGRLGNTVCRDQVPRQRTESVPVSRKWDDLCAISWNVSFTNLHLSLKEIKEPLHLFSDSSHRFVISP